MLSGNDVLWTFVQFFREDHTNFQTLVAFLNMLSTLVCEARAIHTLTCGAIFVTLREYYPLSSLMYHSFQTSTQEGAAKVFDLLQDKTFRSIG